MFRHSIFESKKIIDFCSNRCAENKRDGLVHNNTATFYFNEKKEREKASSAHVPLFFLLAELILSFGASKYRPYVGWALPIRLHCGASGWVHQEKISQPLCRPLSHWPVTRPAPFEGTPDIPADNLFHSSAQLSEDRPNHSTRPALWGPFQKVLFSVLSPFYAFPPSHLIGCHSQKKRGGKKSHRDFLIKRNTKWLVSFQMGS